MTRHLPLLALPLPALLACSEYGFSGEKSHAGGDDTGADDPGTDRGDDHGGSETGRSEDEEEGGGDSGCSGDEYTVDVSVAADDVFTAYVDGVELGSAEAWWEAHSYTATVGCGPHVVAVYATDLHQAISGFIGSVSVDGEVVSVTGDGQWNVYGGVAPDGWLDPEYDDGGWGPEVACERSSATSWWGNSPQILRAGGAWWIWARECLALGDASFRLDLDLP